jgi:hypothetical protein
MDMAFAVARLRRVRNRAQGNGKDDEDTNEQ